MEDTGLDIRISSLVECDVVEVDGELDCQTAPDLAEALQQAAGDGRPVVIDLTRLRFIDSSGVHVLMSGAGVEEARCVVVCPPGNVARVLSIVRAEAAMSIYDDLEKALDGVRSSTDGRG